MSTSNPVNVKSDKNTSTPDTLKPTTEIKKVKMLEEDDEFEDFPAEDWTEAETEIPGGKQHLWEESWDDDDTSEDFSKQLREELKKVEAAKQASSNDMQR